MLMGRTGKGGLGNKCVLNDGPNVAPHLTIFTVHAHAYKNAQRCIMGEWLMGTINGTTGT